jgi:hypothetical protein
MPRRKATTATTGTVADAIDDTSVAESQATQTPTLSATLFQRVTNHLDEHQWDYTDDAENGVITAGVRLTNVVTRLRLIIRQADAWERVIVLMVFPNFVPEGRRAAVASAIARLNYEEMFVAFEMDMSDGELRVKTMAECDSVVTELMIEHAISRNLAFGNEQFAGLLALSISAQEQSPEQPSERHPEHVTLQ